MSAGHAKHRPLEPLIDRIRNCATVMRKTSEELMATLTALALPESSRRASEIIAGPLTAGNPGLPADTLTRRQQEVLKLLAEGKTTKEAAACLGISPKTIVIHRSQIVRKLGFRSHHDLIIFAIRAGIITLSNIG